MGVIIYFIIALTVHLLYMAIDRSKYSADTLRILRDCGAFVSGSHFVYSSGRHGDCYINKDALYSRPQDLDDVSAMLASMACECFSDIEVVVSPTVGGVILGHNVAYNLDLLLDGSVRFAFSDCHPLYPTRRVIRRGYRPLIKGKKVLLVDDIITTGHTLSNLAMAVVAAGGTPIGAACVCDRGTVRRLSIYPQQDMGTFALELVIEPLLEMDVQTFAAADCPLCKANRPIDPDLGKGSLVDPFHPHPQPTGMD